MFTFFSVVVTMDESGVNQQLITMSNMDLTTALMEPPPSTIPSFMHNFDIDLIGTPGQPNPENFQKGKDPEWVHGYNQMLFVEPTHPQPLALAYWDFHHQG